MTNLGRLVKWQEKDGGWHTGSVILKPLGGVLTLHTLTGDYGMDPYTLVQESCTYQLSWVLHTLLQPWETREQRAERGEE